MVIESKIRYGIIIGLAFLILICCIVLVDADDNILTLNNSTISRSNSLQPISITVTTSSNNDLSVQLNSYRNNLTYYQKKIPNEILEITDPNYPKTGMSPESIKAVMVNSNQLRGNQVYLIIHLKPTASLHNIDSIASSIPNRNEEFHSLVAWIELKNVSVLASMDEVVSIKLVVPPAHSGEGNVSPSANETKPIGVISNTFLSVTKTPTASVSLDVIWVSLLIMIVFGIISKRGRNLQ